MNQTIRYHCRLKYAKGTQRKNRASLFFLSNVHLSKPENASLTASVTKATINFKTLLIILFKGQGF